MDWRDITLPRSVEIQMVSTQNPSDVIGILHGVDLGSSSLDAAYDTDTRTSGKLSVVNGNWVRGTFLRVVATIGDSKKTLGTYLVADDSGSYSNGAWVRELTLHSMLYALSTDKAVNPWTVAKDASAMTAARQMLNGAGKPFRIDGDDHVMTEAVVFESGTSVLERVMSLSKMADSRVDVEPDGTIVVSRYKNPDAKPASFEIDLSDRRGIAIDGLQFSSDFLSMPTRFAYVYRWNEGSGDTSVQKEYSAYADRSGAGSAAARGWTITEFQVLDEADYSGNASVQAAADRALAESKEQVEWKLKTMFLPIWEGDTVDLIVPDGAVFTDGFGTLEGYTGRRHCIVKSISIGLGDLSMDLTLKETAGGDADW